MIEVMRQQAYPGSEIVTEEELGPGSSYDQYIASYQSEGLKIYALLTVPQGQRPESGWPVVVFNHGYIPPDQYRVAEMMFLINFRLAIVSLVTIPLMMFLSRWIAKRTRKGFREQQESLGRLNGLIEKTITGQRVVKAYVREEAAIEQFDAANCVTSDGEIIERGTHGGLLAQRGFYHNLYMGQFKGQATPEGKPNWHFHTSRPGTAC